MSPDLRLGPSLAWSYGGTIANLVAQMAFAAMAARLVAPEAYGVAAVAGGVVGYLSYLTDFGLSLAAVRDRGLQPADLWGMALIGSVANLMIMAGLWAGAPAIAALAGLGESGVWVLRVLSVLAPLGGINAAAQAWLNRQMDFRALALAALVGRIVGQGAVTLPLAWAGWGVWALAAGSIAQVLAGLAVALWRHPLQWPDRSRWPKIRRALALGANFSLIRLLDATQAFMLPLAVAVLAGTAAAGLLDRGALFTLVALELVTGAAGRVMLPLYGALAEGDGGRIPAAYLAAARRILCLVLPLGAGVAATAEPLVAAMLGARWSELAEPLRLMALLAALRSVAMLAGGLIEARGRLGLHVSQRLAVIVLLLGWFALVRPDTLSLMLQGAIVAEMLSAAALTAIAAQALGCRILVMLEPVGLGVSVALPVAGIMALVAAGDGAAVTRLVSAMICGGLSLLAIAAYHPHAGLRRDIRNAMSHVSGRLRRDNNL